MEKKQRPARMEFLHELLEFADVGAQKAGFSEELRSRIRLATEEAMVNVILHAYPEGGGEVNVGWMKTDESGLILEIRDRGALFDPLAAGDPDLMAEVAERKVGGLGIFFIKEVTDRVEYRRDGEENVLTLTFLNRSGSAG